MSKKELLEELIDSLVNRPNEWWLDDSGYTLNHESGLELWAIQHSLVYVIAAANPSVHRPDNIEFGFFDRLRLRKAMIPVIRSLKQPEQAPEDTERIWTQFKKKKV